MVQPSRETLDLANEIQAEMAGNSLIPSFAKLYSQYTRLQERRPGLSRWRANESASRLDDAMTLIETCLIRQEAGLRDWRDGMRRAGELLEWLSHPELNPDSLPIHLLSAAAYQLAGYPARASGLLNESIKQESESEILRSLLKADFPDVLYLLTNYWARETNSNSLGISRANSEITEDLQKQLNHKIVKETISSLGVLCASMRWGDEPRLERAINKLSNISKVFLHGENTYSWMLSKLCFEVASLYPAVSMRRNLSELLEGISPIGRVAIDRYLKQSYKDRKSLAWPSQLLGIQKLISRESFALCTPTGSGKTTIAELAILQSLFLDTDAHGSSDNISNPLAIYLVPSRALAAEVESKLARVLRFSSNEQVKVTGLYGGTDWGPTDAWLTTEDRIVLICTYEKAEALFRFLGTLFLYRVKLVVIDEAHAVQFDENYNTLQSSENRSLRLEVLGMRLLTYLDQSRSRIIALSAVAAGAGRSIASWVSQQREAIPAETLYQSTRQLIGRLECLENRRFKIYYDLLDGARLEFQEAREPPDRPYIIDPFPQYPLPPGHWNGPEKKLRPYLFWSAMNLASIDSQGRRHAVLIAIAQQPEGYAKDFLTLLASNWAETERPVFFEEPNDPRKFELWQRCLRSCEDYFGRNSREYQLLERGVVVHHGKMPGLMARLFIELIQEKVVQIVLATSTLSEGVNLPFEVILIPSLYRGQHPIPVREFRNLVGRAGRPGSGTEGRSLILLGSEDELSGSQGVTRNRQRIAYENLILEIRQPNNSDSSISNFKSPLAELLSRLKTQWQNISNSNSTSDFLNWLEQTKPLEISHPIEDDNLSAIDTLDSLDSVLISAIVELDQLSLEELTVDELEVQIRIVWHNSYAFYANQQQFELETIFVHRGKALKNSIYPEASQRRRLYKTSLPPRSGNQLLSIYPNVKQHLETGENYFNWSTAQRIYFIENLINYLGNVPNFRPQEKKLNWRQVLHWWLDPSSAIVSPTETQISNWHAYISRNFNYKFNWGLGSILSLVVDEAFGSGLLEISLEDWSRTGLPWIGFWLKELITWGTLNPVAAYLLSKSFATTRNEASQLSLVYYQQHEDLDANNILNASVIKNWADRAFSDPASSLPLLRPSNRIRVNLLRDFNDTSNSRWRVLPVEISAELFWFDPAGFPLAKCPKPDHWQASYLYNYDFILDSESRMVLSEIFV